MTKLVLTQFVLNIIIAGSDSAMSKPVYPGGCLLPRIRRAAEGETTITFVGSAAEGEEEQTITWSQLHEDALSAAACLQEQGILPGDHVALLGLTSRPLITAIQGAWLAGACINMLPIPMRMGSLGEFAAQTRAHIKISEAKMVLIDPDLAAFYEAEKDDPPLVKLDGDDRKAATTGRLKATRKGWPSCNSPPAQPRFPRE